MSSQKNLEQTTPDKPKDEWRTIFIHKKYIRKQKNKQGEYFFIVSLVSQEGIPLEVYIPFSWLREEKTGKGYTGRFKIDHTLSGAQKVKTSINTNDIIKFFPLKKIGRSK